jgi:hypothetical protein
LVPGFIVINAVFIASSGKMACGGMIMLITREQLMTPMETEKGIIHIELLFGLPERIPGVKDGIV